MSIFAADLVVDQQLSPEVVGTSGELAASSSIKGSPALMFTATDGVSGIYAARTLVDGKQVRETLLDSNAGRCKDVGGTTDGAPAFLYLRPCAETVHADVTVPTEGLKNGSHHIQVLVTDAAGNATTVIDRQVVVDNGKGGGTPLSTVHGRIHATWSRDHRTSLTVPFGASPRISGRLLGPSSVPLRHVELDALARPSSPGAATIVFARVHTDADGRFTLTLPRGVSSRTVTLVYSSVSGLVRTLATAALHLNVHAGVQLSVWPHVSSVGRVIRFTGRLEGRPVPAAGKPIVLQARAPGGRWIDFKVVRAGRRGRFTASYRFRYSGPAHYEFRAVSEREASYAFLAGASSTVRVFEH